MAVFVNIQPLRGNCQFRRFGGVSCRPGGDKPAVLALVFRTGRRRCRSGCRQRGRCFDNCRELEDEPAACRGWCACRRLCRCHIQRGHPGAVPAGALSGADGDAPRRQRYPAWRAGLPPGCVGCAYWRCIGSHAGILRCRHGADWSFRKAGSAWRKRRAGRS